MNKKHISPPKDGLAYTLHLKNSGITIYNAIYHHCALSGKHYFIKGNEVYPIEDVYSHSVQGHEIKEISQNLTGHIYSHLIQVTLTSVIPENKLTKIPDSVYDWIVDHLELNCVEGEFTEEQTGDNIYFPSEENKHGTDVYTVVAGSWRIIQLEYNTIYPLIMWWNNHYTSEDLNLEHFITFFGKEMGTLYYAKWIGCKHNLIDAFGIFTGKQEDGQIFCNMLMQQVEQYQKKQHGEKQ
ncbi:hypothetical protein [Bacteroides fragilis]|uniref:hypothetical protein n=1 Tax=Bacteroides fragilis TaxID=817 RepID=UPI00189F2000|nr:hypothetical protein [Bacteroides fragilis]